MSCTYNGSKDLFEFDTAIELAADSIICKVKGRKAVVTNTTTTLYSSTGLAWSPPEITAEDAFDAESILIGIIDSEDWGGL